MTIRSRLQTCMLLAISFAGCVTANGPGSDGSWVVSEPYHHPLAGVGGGAIIGSILVPEKTEFAVASIALVNALQNQQLSIRTPSIGVDGVIPPRVRWNTDIAPLPMDVIALHNQRFPLLTLRVAYYGIAYEGMYDTGGDLFRYKISAHLYERGALSAWSSVTDERYSGQFFVRRLGEDIRGELHKRDHRSQ